MLYFHYKTSKELKMRTKTTKTTVNQPSVSSEELKELLAIIPNINKENTMLNQSVVRYVQVKEGIKALNTEKATLKAKVFAELSNEISMIKASGLSTKSAYKKAIDTLKGKYSADKALNFELGLLTYFLNLGLSLNKIESNASNLSKWRRDKLTLDAIIKLAK